MCSLFLPAVFLSHVRDNANESRDLANIIQLGSREQESNLDLSVARSSVLSKAQPVWKGGSLGVKEKMQLKCRRGWSPGIGQVLELKETSNVIWFYAFVFWGCWGLETGTCLWPFRWSAVSSSWEGMTPVCQLATGLSCLLQHPQISRQPIPEDSPTFPWKFRKFRATSGDMRTIIQSTTSWQLNKNVELDGN